MALQTSADARAAWELRHPEYKDYGSLTVIDINDAITAAVESCIVLTLNIEKVDSAIKIIQSDDSRIDLDDLMIEIRAKGYEVSVIPNHTTADLHVSF